MKEKLCSNEECTLCMACRNICPVNAIILEIDEHGYEKISINRNRCIECGMCSNVCARRHVISRKFPSKSFAAQMLNKKRLESSASGGAFQTLAIIVLEAGGICYGAESVYENENFSARHVRITSINDLEKILNSKYIPSIIGFTYKQAEEDLKKGKKVLFSGTPCQILGLKAYLNKEYKNLLTVDLICHGITSTKIFNDYIKQIEKKESITIVKYFFRDKSISWGTNFCYSYYRKDDPLRKIKIKHCPREASSYMIHYLRGNIFRESCYHCMLASTQRVSDFTVGDYWEIETEHPEFVAKNNPKMILRRGISCILMNTNQAQIYIPELRKK